MTTNPTALRSSLKHEDVEKHRSLLCAEYDECLDTALRRSWNGWTCARCKHFSLAAARRAEARAAAAAAAVELS